MKKLYRSNSDKVIGGVLGGFAEYSNVDPTVVRLGYVLLSLTTCFSGVLFYIIAWIIIPQKPSHVSAGASAKEDEVKHHSDHKSEKENTEEKSNVSHETKKED